VQAMAADGGRIQCRAEPALSIVGRSLHAGRLYVYSISLLHPWLLRLHPALVLICSFPGFCAFTRLWCLPMRVQPGQTDLREDGPDGRGRR